MNDFFDFLNFLLWEGCREIFFIFCWFCDVLLFFLFHFIFCFGWRGKFFFFICFFQCFWVFLTTFGPHHFCPHHFWLRPLLGFFFLIKPFCAQTFANHPGPRKTWANGVALRGNLLLMSCFLGHGPPSRDPLCPRPPCAGSPVVLCGVSLLLCCGVKCRCGALRPLLQRTPPDSAGPPNAGASHDSPKTPTCTFEGCGLQSHHQNSTKRKKNENSGGSAKKSAKFWAFHPSGAPPIGGTTFRGPSLRGPTFF